MKSPESTCWDVIQGAAQGNQTEREGFARHYAAIVRAYLATRWRGTAWLQEIDDAIQEVFVECFRHGGALERADREQPGGFRRFLCGVVRNVALRIEMGPSRWRERQPPSDFREGGVADDERTLSQVFDRAWAVAIMREAAELQAARARATPDDGALKRKELLRLRAEEGLPIRKIANRWREDPARLHHEYARARKEFKAALTEIVAFHHPGSRAEIEQECRALLSLLA